MVVRRRQGLSSGCRLVAIRASDLAESIPATLRGSIAFPLQQNMFLFCD